MQGSLDGPRARARALLVFVAAGIALLAGGAAPPSEHSAHSAPSTHQNEAGGESGTATGRALREQAQKSELAMQLVTSLTTEIGPRPAGSPALLRAADWALAAMRRLGLDNVHSEPVTVPHWVRGEATGEILAPWPQPVVLTALGGSVGTPEEGVTAELVRYPTLAALTAAPEEQVRGRIVFLDLRMQRT